MSTYTRRRIVGTFAAAGAGAILGPHLRIKRALALTWTPSPVLAWNEAALEAIRKTRTNPPIAARALAILHTCIFDAWAAYDERAIATAAAQRRPRAEHTPANQAEAISHAAYRASIDLFPAESARFDEVMKQLGYKSEPSVDPNTPASVGTRAAQAVIAARHTDGSNQLGDLAPGAYADYSQYQPINRPDKVVDLDRWQPMLLPDGKGGTRLQKFIVPHWHLVKPFALTSGAQFRPSAPYRHGTAEYRRQAQEVIAMSAQLSDRDKLISEYWIDGPGTETPPGHWCVLARFVAERDSHDLSADVKMFFVLTNALMDASIAAWDTKRAYDAVRPFTAIRHLFADDCVQAWAGVGLGTRAIAGGDWVPYQMAGDLTPPHPEYVSGHSTFSTAAAEALRRFTGSDRFGASHTQRRGTCKIEPGLVPATDLTLQWPTFSAAADEAGLSRRLGGIHFAAADLSGRRLGRAVGTQTWQKARAYINGTPNARPA